LFIVAGVEGWRIQALLFQSDQVLSDGHGWISSSGCSFLMVLLFFYESIPMLWISADLNKRREEA
jgi:hypothetical protein